MNCGQFRQFYSDFTDGLLDEIEEVEFHVHMAECVACRRFDAALEQGRSALRSMEPQPAGGDFESRLYDRILRLDEIRPEPALRQWSGMAGAVLVMAVFGVVGLNVRTALRPAVAPFRQAEGSAGASAQVFTPRLERFAIDSAFQPSARNATGGPVRTDSLGVAQARQGVEITTNDMVP